MTDLDPMMFGPEQQCYGCGPRHPTGFHLRFALDGEEVVTRFTPSDDHQGPPGMMHGGLVATLADEIGSWALIGLLGKFGFTATMNARFLRPVRVGVEVVGRSHIRRKTSRTVNVAVKLIQADVDVFSGELLFAMLDLKATEKLIGRELPEDWRKFAR